MQFDSVVQRFNGVALSFAVAKRLVHDLLGEKSEIPPTSQWVDRLGAAYIGSAPRLCEKSAEHPNFSWGIFHFYLRDSAALLLSADV